MTLKVLCAIKYIVTYHGLIDWLNQPPSSTRFQSAYRCHKRKCCHGGAQRVVLHTKLNLLLSTILLRREKINLTSEAGQCKHYTLNAQAQDESIIFTSATRRSSARWGLKLTRTIAMRHLHPQNNNTPTPNNMGETWT